MDHPVTPDGRYFVVRGRLWRRSDPDIPEPRRVRLVADLMRARRCVRKALGAGDEIALRDARAAVDAAKLALGERGSPWWTDGAPDYNRCMVRNTPYAAWFDTLTQADEARGGSAAFRGPRARGDGPAVRV
jgi:hypothetical protein